MTDTMMTTALTYEEIAARTDISLASARRLVHRRKWRKTKGNDGRAVVQVPNEFLDSHHGKHHGGRDVDHNDDPSGAHDDGDAPRNGDAKPSAIMTDMMARLMAAQDSLTDAARKLGVAEGEIAVLRTQVDEARATIAALSEKASRADTLDAVLAAERQRVAEWQAVADRFAGQAEKLATAQAWRGWWPFGRRA